MKIGQLVMLPGGVDLSILFDWTLEHKMSFRSLDLLLSVLVHVVFSQFDEISRDSERRARDEREARALRYNRVEFVRLSCRLDLSESISRGFSELGHISQSVSCHL